MAPSLGPMLAAARVPREAALVDRRVVLISGIAIAIALASGVVAQVLIKLILFFTNLAFFGRLSIAQASPADNALGWWVVLVPVAGGIVVGLMARYGSKAIRGHGIPEAMEQVLTNKSKIPPRVTFLKPLSAAISIGTGGPFGAEGPIIATGGALGSLVGQLLETTADERKTLLAAGAAAGMTATFGSPVSAVLLAIELLLFELRPRSIIPVALACATAAGVRLALVPPGAIFEMPAIAAPSAGALSFYIALGALVGVVAVLVTRVVYGIEDAFDRLPIHWMWWPALGGIAVGVVGIAAPRTLGVGYTNIEDVVQGRIAGTALVALFAWKFVSWSISLGSGTSGGTLAPLFTIGGGLGAALGGVAATALPAAAIDPKVAGLVGMAAIFAGASRALLASVVFAFETTGQPHGLLPLLGGCTAAYLVSCLLMRTTIMTEKIARRGVVVPSEYAADFLASVLVRDVASREVATIAANATLEEARARLERTRHQGFPVVAEDGKLAGMVTRRDILEPKDASARRVRDLLERAPVVVFEENTLRDAADQMAREDVGRLPVVSRTEPTKLLGIVTRSDLLRPHQRRLDEAHRAETAIDLSRLAGSPPAEQTPKRVTPVPLPLAHSQAK